MPMREVIHMDVFTAISDRRSIRKYQAKEVEEHKIEKILEAGRLSPSAGNRQEWKFVVVRDKAIKQQLAAAAHGQSFVEEAPVVLVGCAVDSSAIMSCGQYTYTVDLSIAFAYMILEAQELGLGTCWLGAFEEDAVKKALDIPEEVRVVAMMPLGYPAESPAPRPRKSMKDIVSYEKYQ
jgi:nitroreductase